MDTRVAERYSKAFNRYLSIHGETITFVSNEGIAHNIPEPNIWKIEAIVGRTQTIKYEDTAIYTVSIRISVDNIDGLAAVNNPLRTFPNWKSLSNSIDAIICRGERYMIRKVDLNTFGESIIITAEKES
jgi:hypothetical protein